MRIYRLSPLPLGMFLVWVWLAGCRAEPATSIPLVPPAAQQEKEPPPDIPETQAETRTPNRKPRAAEEEILDIAETNNGYLFVDGLFIRAPYKLKVKGLAILVNELKVSEIVPISPRTKEDEEEEKRYVASLSEAERKHWEKSEHAMDIIFENFPKWCDFHGEEEAMKKLEGMLRKEREEGRIPRYDLHGGGVMLFNQEGEEEEVLLYSGEVSLGPPYEQYNIDSIGFAEKLAELAKHGSARYGRKGAKEILGNFLSSQKQVSKFRFDQHAEENVVIIKPSGAEKTFRIAFGTSEGVRRDHLDEMRRGVVDNAKSLAESLNRGSLILIDTRGTEENPGDDLETLKMIRDILSRGDIDSEEKAALLAEGGLDEDIAAQIVAHAKENLPLLHDAIAGIKTDE